MTPDERKRWLALHQRRIKIMQQMLEHADVNDGAELKLYLAEIDKVEADIEDLLSVTFGCDAYDRYDAALNNLDGPAAGGPAAWLDRIRQLVRDTVA